MERKLQRTFQRETYYTADNQKPYDNIHRIIDPLRILADLSIDSDLTQKFPTNGQVENSTNTNRSKEANEGGMRKVFNLVDLLPHDQNYGHSASQKN